MSLDYSSLLGIAGPSPEDSTPITVWGKLYGLEALPVEILLDIYRELDVESVYRLAQTNTLFQGLLRRNKSRILLPILQKEFSPFDELLQVYTASDEDAQEHGGTFQPRRVIYRRYPGDVVGVVLCRGGLSALAGGPPGSNRFAQISGGNHRPAVTVSLPPPRSVALNERDLQSLLKYCRVTRKWEDIYPRLHWMAEPENCRQLHTAEKEKLRRALYRWWLHALYFHGDHPRPRRGEPEPFTHDIRISQTRVYPTSELMELRALSASAKNLIRHYIFPNLEQKLHESESTPLEQIIEMSIRERIVDTYAKLDPQELMYYFENLYSYPRRRLVTDVNIRHPTFVHDQESLQAAIRAAIDERHWLIGIDNLEEVGGIVGPVRVFDQSLSNDGSRDGSIPAPGMPRRPRGDWSPPGDDGRALTERIITIPCARP